MLKEEKQKPNRDVTNASRIIEFERRLSIIGIFIEQQRILRIYSIFYDIPLYVAYPKKTDFTEALFISVMSINSAIIPVLLPSSSVMGVIWIVNVRCEPLKPKSICSLLNTVLFGQPRFQSHQRTCEELLLIQAVSKHLCNDCR